MEGHIKSHIQKGIATVSFFHPQSNSMPGHLLRQLAAEITAVSNNAETKVIVIKSEGEKAFCAGASFDELIAIENLDQGQVFFSGFAGVINAVRKAKQLVIVRVHGKAVGGGVGIASAADYTIAVDKAEIKLSELAVGIGPFVIGPAVVRKMGNTAFSHMSVTPDRWYSADYALQNGLFAEVHTSVESLDNAVQALAEQLTKYSPEAMADLKKVMWEGTENWDELLAERAGISGRLVLSDFTRNFIQSFKAKTAKS